jgi:hypothetical protein
MRRTALALLATLPLLPATGHAQSGAPHSWLFGEWTGGLFPAPANLTAQACLGQPTVIFTRDVVIRGSLTEVNFTQRVIVTARTTSGQTDIQFTPALDALAANSNGLLGLDQPKASAGFGCETEDVLHIRRISENEISFPGCKEFPEPLVRCQGK